MRFWGLARALADMSAKNVCFFLRLPLLMFRLREMPIAVLDSDGRLNLGFSHYFLRDFLGFFLFVHFFMSCSFNLKLKHISTSIIILKLKSCWSVFLFNYCRYIFFYDVEFDGLGCDINMYNTIILQWEFNKYRIGLSAPLPWVISHYKSVKMAQLGNTQVLTQEI